MSEQRDGLEREVGLADPAELLSGRQVAVILHVEKQVALDLIASGAIPSLPLGGRRRVPRWALIEWQRKQMQGAA